MGQGQQSFHPSNYFSWSLSLILMFTVNNVESIGTLHLQNDPLVAVYDNAVPDELMDILKANFKTMQNTGHSIQDKKIGQARKAWLSWPPPKDENIEDDLLLSWIRYLIKNIPELSDHGPYEAVDYWLQDHPHTHPMWFHYDLGMSVESGLAVHPTFSALVYLQDGAPVLMLPQTMRCLEPMEQLRGCKVEDMVSREGYEYDIPIEHDATTVDGFNALKQAYLVKAKASSILVFDGTLMHGPLPHQSQARGVTGVRRELLGIHFWKSKPDFGDQSDYYETGTIRYTKKHIGIEDTTPPQLQPRALQPLHLTPTAFGSTQEYNLVVKKSPLTAPSDIVTMKLIVDKHRLMGCDFCRAAEAIVRIGPELDKSNQRKVKEKRRKENKKKKAKQPPKAARGRYPSKGNEKFNTPKKRSKQTSRKPAGPSDRRISNKKTRHRSNSLKRKGLKKEL